jgi:hypothetical protein
VVFFKEQTMTISHEINHPIIIAEKTTSLPSDFWGSGYQRKESVYPGPPEHPAATYYTVPNGQRVRLHTWNLDHNPTQDEVAALAMRYRRENFSTELWDDAWYYRTLPREWYILMLAVNLDVVGDEFYVKIHNGEKYWTYSSNRTNGGIVREGSDGKVKLQLTIAGKPIDVDLWNPVNQNGWTPDDLIISWGY